jgi:dUTP pyrophosphatase
MEIKFKKLSDLAVTPTYAHVGDAGLDLTATSRTFDEHGNASYGTGIAVEIPEGYVGLIFPRSSVRKQDLLLSNSVGIIDSIFRGEICFNFKPSLVFTSYLQECEGLGENTETFEDVEIPEGNVVGDIQLYNVGDRIGQLIIIPYPQIELVEVTELSDTERGTNGFGSSGN